MVNKKMLVAQLRKEQDQNQKLEKELERVRDKLDSVNMDLTMAVSMLNDKNRKLSQLQDEQEKNKVLCAELAKELAKPCRLNEFATTLVLLARYHESIGDDGISSYEITKVWDEYLKEADYGHRMD